MCSPEGIPNAFIEDSFMPLEFENGKATPD